MLSFCWSSSDDSIASVIGCSAACAALGADGAVDDELELELELDADDADMLSCDTSHDEDSHESSNPTMKNNGSSHNGLN